MENQPRDTFFRLRVSCFPIFVPVVIYCVNLCLAGPLRRRREGLRKDALSLRVFFFYFSLSLLLPVLLPAPHPFLRSGARRNIFAYHEPGFIAGTTFTEIGKSPVRCKIKMVISEADELGYEITFCDGFMVTYLDSSILYSVPLNNECNVFDVVPDFTTRIEASRETIGSVNEKDNILLALINNKFCIEVLQMRP